MMGPTMIDVGGVMGADATSDPGLRQMFQSDPMGTLGWLQRPYQEGAAVFQFDAAKDAWVPRTRVLDFMGSGTGEPGADVGFSGAQGDDATSLLRGGNLGDRACFAAQGMALRFSCEGYTPAGSTTDALTAVPAVSRDGVARPDVAEIARRFSGVFFGGAIVEFFEMTRKCFVLLGKAESFCDDAPVPFKRVLVMQPDNDYVFRLRSGRSIAIPRDGNHAAPPDGTVVVFTVQFSLDGYFCNAEGVPLVTPTDNAEGVQAMAYSHTPPVLRFVTDAPKPAPKKAAARKPAKKLPKAA